MTDPELGAWLRREREQRGWSKREMARQMVRAGRGNGGGNPSFESILRCMYRWETEGGVSDRQRLLYCGAFGIGTSQFGPRASAEPRELAIPQQPAGPATTAPAALSGYPDLTDLPLPTSATMIYRGLQEPVSGRFAVAREVLMAGHETSGHAAEREPYGVGEITLEQLRADVMRLSQQTVTGSPLLTFRDLRQVRDRIYLLLDRRLRLRETGDLYFLLCCVSELMSIPANQLGYPDTAEELLRAGWAYASIIEHNPLLAKLRAQLADVVYWRGRHSECLDLATDGLRYVSQGRPAAELHVFRARAAARLGDVDTARRAVSLAHEAQNSDYSNDVLDIGGEFVISQATHYAQSGSGLVDVSGAERDAATELEQAISLYNAGPDEREQHWFAGKPLAGIDLAVVRLRSGALDAAVAALEPALALPAEQRISDITNRLDDVRRELAAPVFQRAPQARDLTEQIEAFSSDTVTADLHSLTG